MNDDTATKGNMLAKAGAMLFEGYRNKKFTWKETLGELCDNSFDAGATNIEIAFKKKNVLVVSDNGNGCRDIEGMLTISKHLEQETTSLGRYGIGLKETACLFWGKMLVETIYKGTKYQASVDWPWMSKNNCADFKILTPVPAADSEVGTSITFLKHDRKKPPNYQPLADALGYLFYPAIADGRQIRILTLNGSIVLVKAWEIPKIEDMLKDEFEINGKSVNLMAGIVPAGTKNYKSGFTFTFGHRVVQENDSFGAKDKGTSRICGIVRLGSNWRLEKNKGSITDPDIDLLEDEIFSRCEGILDKASQQIEIIENNALLNNVINNVGNVLNTCKESRNQTREKSGTVEPKDTGVKRVNATKTKPGDHMIERVKRGGLIVEWGDFKDEEIGRVNAQVNKIPRVILNKENPMLKRYRTENNSDALADTCIWMLAAAATERFHAAKSIKEMVGTDGSENIFSIMTRLSCGVKQQQKEN